MKITVLCENTTERSDILSEHGLSLYIETKNKKILFDMGQSDVFAKNADTMGTDLSDVDFAVLSHGHYDHGGGIETFLSLNEKADIYVNENAFGEHYNADGKYIGIKKKLKEIPRVVTVGDEYSLCEGVTLFSCNDRERRYPTEAYGLSVRKNHENIVEDFLHEQYLLIEEDGKTVLISGCSHKGILSIVDWFRPDFLVGGFHFMKLGVAGDDADKLRKYAEILLSYPTSYYTGHCTGEEQFLFLKEIMGDRLAYIPSGTVLKIF